MPLPIGSYDEHHVRSRRASTSAGSGANSPQQSALAFAACVRSHGVPSYPDSAVHASSKGSRALGASRYRRQLAAVPVRYASMPELAAQGPSSGSSSSSYVQAVLKYSLCMRSHGVTNFPEPNSQGLFTVERGSTELAHVPVGKRGLPAFTFRRLHRGVNVKRAERQPHSRPCVDARVRSPHMASPELVNMDCPG